MSRTHLFLLHEFGVGAVIDDVLAKHRRCQDRVDVLGGDILDLSVEDELVALCSNVDGSLLAEQDEGENVAKFRSVLVEECHGVHAIRNSAPYDREPGKHHRGFIWVLEQDLLGDMPKD